MTTPATTAPTYLAEITVYDPSIPGTRVLRYASKPFTTKGSETPASQWYNPVIKQPVDVTRNLFTGGNTSGASIVGLGDLVLLNADGSLDDLLLYGFDGQSLTVRVTTVLNPAYPGDFTTVLQGTMQAAEFDDQTVTIKVRDLLAALGLPFQTNKYGGTNVLPNGLDGVASDLQGKVKPVLLGGSVTNISPPCVNTSKQIYQISDGAIASVDAVRDRGVALNPNTTSQWNLVTAPLSGIGVFVRIAYGGGVFLLARLSTGAIYRSTDGGVTWTSITTLAPMHDRGFAWNGSVWLYLGTTNTYTSPDGVAWTSHAPMASAATVNNLAWSSANNLWVATGNSFIKTSPDGLTWTTQYTATQVFGVCEGFGLMIVVGPGLILSSSDCLTWTTRYTDSTYTLYDVVYTGTMLCAIGDLSVTSTDGFTWQRHANVPFFGFGMNNLTYTNGLFMLVQSATRYFSADGANWTTVVDLTFSPYPAASSGTRAVAVDTANALGGYTSPVAYASQADLLDDTKAPPPGGYIAYLAGGYVRLGSVPTGTLTCDATQGANAAARTAAQLYNTVQLRANASASVNATDLTTLDGLNSAPLGLWINADTTFVDVIDQITNSVGAGWWPSASGQWRIKRIDAPSGNPVLSLTVNDLIQPLTVVPTTDNGGGVPSYRCTVNWGRNYTVQTTDLASGVTDDWRSTVAQEWRSVNTTDVTVQAAHPLAPALSKDSLFIAASDAQTEANRWQALMGVQRYRFLAVAQMNSETLPLDLADELELVSPRFALQVIGGDTGALFLILDIQPDAQNQTISLTAWGQGQASRNIVTDDGLDWVTDDGIYVVTKAEN